MVRRKIRKIQMCVLLCLIDPRVGKKETRPLVVYHALGQMFYHGYQDVFSAWYAQRLLLLNFRGSGWSAK